MKISILTSDNNLSTLDLPDNESNEFFDLSREVHENNRNIEDAVDELA